MENKRIIEIIARMQAEVDYEMELAIELKALSEKDPQFVEKLEEFLKHCEEERKR